MLLTTQKRTSGYNTYPLTHKVWLYTWKANVVLMHVIFVVDEVSLWGVSLPAVPLSPVSIVPPTLNDPLNPLNAELNPICHLLALLGGATIVVFSRLRVNPETTPTRGTKKGASEHYGKQLDAVEQKLNSTFFFRLQSSKHSPTASLPSSDALHTVTSQIQTATSWLLGWCNFFVVTSGLLSHILL
jgi:hypothetical protein